MKLSNLSKIGIVSVCLAMSGAAFAESPSCGEPKDDSWLDQNVVLEEIQSLGYTIETLGVSEGNCYQMTGLNVKGNNVTAYIDPRTGDVVQEDVVQ